MLFNKYTDKLSNMKSEARFYRIFILMLVLANVFLAWQNRELAGKERIVIVPPEIEKSFWVDKTRVSREYLEQMAYWFASLALNVTPATGEYQKQTFLRYADPAHYGSLQVDIDDRLAYIKKNNASTVFSPQEILVDEKNKKVALIGKLTTFVGDKKVSERLVGFRIGFNYLNGRSYVTEFVETDTRNPFGNGDYEQ